MHEKDLVTIEQVAQFLDGTQGIAFTVLSDIEICGAWVWVTGETKQHSKELGKNGAGFFYASKKKAWYFRPSDWKSSSRGKYSLDDIRTTHGSQKVKSKEQYKLSA